MKSDLDILTYLKSGNPDGFMQAAADTGINFWENENNLSVLLQSLPVENLGLRDFTYRTVTNLSEKGKKTASDYLINYLFETNKELRNFSADLLTKLGDVSNPKLVELLECDDIDVIKIVCDILGFTGTDNNIPAIVMLLNHEDLNIFNSAIETIGNIYERNKEKIGLADSMVKLLVNFYNLNNIDTKPIIIDSVSKIGGENALKFLLEKLNSKDDIFIKVLLIEGLSDCGNSKELCDMFLNEIYQYPQLLQPVILKAIVSIALRVDYNLNFPENFREISYLALRDNEDDIRNAGLFSLGNNFIKNDIKYLTDEYFKGNEAIRYYILSKFLTERNIDLFNDFLKNYLTEFEINQHNQTIIEMISIISDLIKETGTEIIENLFDAFIDNLRQQLDFEEYEAFETLYLINTKICSTSIMKIANSVADSDSGKFQILLDYLIKI